MTDTTTGGNGNGARLLNLTAPPAPAEQSAAPLLSLRALLDGLEADAAARNDARLTGTRLGPVTGLETLDTELGGALCPGLHILHGAPGIGKTAFALQLAASCECPALYVTCEMPPIELLRRLIARTTGTFLGRLKNGEFDGPAIRRMAEQTVQSAPYMALLDATTGPAVPARILEAARDTRNLAPGNSHLLIVIDSVHSWARASQSEMPEYETLSKALKALQQLSAALACPILGICERNRMTIKAGGQSAAKGTAGFEYGAETVIGLDPAEEKPNRKEPFAVNLTLEKNRNGTQGVGLPMMFNGALQQFTEEEF